MTPLEALTKVVTSIKSWIEAKCWLRDDIDQSFNENSANPVCNKTIATEINSLNERIDDIQVTINSIVATLNEMVNGKNTITFYVNGNKHTAMLDMAWEDYFHGNSIDATCPMCGDPITINSTGTSGCCGTVVIVYEDGTEVSPTDYIEDGHWYGLDCW